MHYIDKVIDFLGTVNIVNNATKKLNNIIKNGK